MPLLPALRWGDARWWLPLEQTTATVLVDQLTAAGQPPGGGEPPRAVAAARRFEAVLREDPALLIWSALSWHLQHPSERPLPLDVRHLADWLAGHLVELFDAEDSLALRPVIDEAARARWADLSGLFGGKAPPEWLAGGEAWLEVTGPSVPAAWKGLWPLLSDFTAQDRLAGERASCARAEGLRHGLPAPDLARLARFVRRSTVLSQRFRATLEEEKRAALYQLAYGLSHEINNPLANISARAQHLAPGEPQPDRRRLLRAIEHQAMRAHEMIADLMFYAHPAAPSRRWVDAAGLVREVVEAFQDQAERSGTLLRGMPSGGQGSAIFVDPDQWADALRALVRNALEAVGAGGHVSARLIEREARVEIEISDDGPGLDAAARRHALDPYYSGREAGRGLGLGLCKAERIAREHGGGVRLSGGPAGCIATLWVPQPNAMRAEPSDRASPAMPR